MTQTHFSRTSGTAGRRRARRPALGRHQGLRLRARRPRHRPDPRAGRDRRLPRPQRRRQDHHHRHGARALAARPRARSRCSGSQPRQAIARGLVSAVMQTGGLLKDLTVRETVAVHREPVRRHRHRSTRCCARPASTEIADRKVGKCSGGEQQRLRFAMALLSDPALLLLDEPTTGMDVEGRRTFWSAIRADAEQGRTVLFATHYLEEADQYADRIVLISQGTHRRRRHRQPDQGAGRRPDRAGHAARTPTPNGSPPLPGVESVDVRGERGLRPRDATPTRSRATCSPRPPPTTSRSPRAASRTPS